MFFRWVVWFQLPKEKSAAAVQTEMKSDSWRNGTLAGRRRGGSLQKQPELQWKGLTRDSKVNPDVLLLLISVADEWEGKITGASQGGPARCPATREPPRSPPQLSPSSRSERFSVAPVLRRPRPSAVMSYLCHAPFHKYQRALKLKITKIWQRYKTVMFNGNKVSRVLKK